MPNDWNSAKTMVANDAFGSFGTEVQFRLV